MLTYKNIILIGTSHIAKQSITEIKKTISEKKPDIIALELDPLRFEAILKPKKKKKLRFKDIKKIGFTGLLFNFIGSWSEKKLGKLVGVSPGSEMKAAIMLAKKNKIQISLIDQDIRITLKKLSKFLTWKEKLRLILDLFKIPLIKPKIKKIDLTKVPDTETIDNLKKEFKIRYPIIYKILVIDRNKFMAKNLYKLSNTFKNKLIIAIIGAGHEKDIFKILENEERKTL